MKCQQCKKNTATQDILCRRCEEMYEFVEHMLYDFNVKVSVEVISDLDEEWVNKNETRPALRTSCKDGKSADYTYK